MFGFIIAFYTRRSTPSSTYPGYVPIAGGGNIFEEIRQIFDGFGQRYMELLDNSFIIINELFYL